MSSPLALPTIFRARAIHAAGLPWLSDGFHFRVKVNPWIGFPIHPFAAWRLRDPHKYVEVPIIWRDAHGRTVAMPFSVQPGDEVVGTVPFTSTDQPWIWMDFDAGGEALRIDLLDSRLVAGEPRILMTRSRDPFTFGDAELVAFRVTGSGVVKSVLGERADSFSVEPAAGHPPDFVFGLPFKPSWPTDWYTPETNAQARARFRVRLGAPQRLSPPDNPLDAHPDATDPDAETARIMNLVGPKLVDPWILAGFRDPATAPVLSVLSRKTQTPPPTNKPVTVSAPVTPSLFTMAVDPQIARYLGLATVLDLGHAQPLERANVWLIASRWAVQRNRLVRKLDDSFTSAIPTSPSAAALKLNAFLASAAAAPGAINNQLDNVFPDAAAIIGRLPTVPAGDGGPWSAVTLLALAVAPVHAPPDPPDPFQLNPFQPGTWNPHDDPANPGPDTWQQMISLGARPARGMVGFARMSPGTAIALQQFVPEHNQPGARVLPLVPNWASNHERLVTDRLVPPAPAGASWQVWHADEFGQWSAGSHLARPLPARPRPPSPQVEATYTAAPDDHTTTPRVPGTIHLALDISRARWSAPGSQPVDKLELTVDGVAQPAIDVAPGQHVERDVRSRAFGVGKQRQVPIVAVYTDAGNRKSPPETIGVGVYDARAPKPVPTSPVVAWTGQPDATGHVELALKWPPMAGAARYRIYLGDVRRLAGDANIALSDSPVRATNAKRVHDRSVTFGDKHLFAFLGETSGKAPDGLIHYSTQIPGSLRGLQFVRIVPTTQGGAEAPFARCGLVPVAIPGVDRPPPPLIETVTDPTGVQLTIKAHGLRNELVAAGAGKAPEYRIRRTRGTATTRPYVPVLPGSAHPLIGPDARGVWSATVSIPKSKLDAFVRYHWFAEVRYPAEPPLPPNVTPEPIDSGVEPAWTALGSSSAAVWSDLSLAAESLLIPPKAPPAPAAPTLTRHADGSVEVKVEQLPIAVPGAIGSYRVELYRASPGKPPELVDSSPTTTTELTLTVPAAVPITDSYILVVVDPIGRRSKPTHVTPPP